VAIEIGAVFILFNLHRESHHPESPQGENEVRPDKGYVVPLDRLD
jgi:hypothetical protein